LSKGDSYLKSDSSILWHDANGANHAKRGDNFVEERSNLRRLASKVVLEIMSSAGMGLVPIRKSSAALGTLP